MSRTRLRASSLLPRALVCTTRSAMCRPMVWARAPWIAGGPVARMTASIWYWPSGKDGSRSTKLSTRSTPGSLASQRLTPYSSATRGAPRGEPAPKSRITRMRVVSWPGNSRRMSSSPRRDSAVGGSISMSLEASRIRAKGEPSRSRTAATGISTRQGWFMTTVVRRTQKPRPPCRRRRARSAAARRPGAGPAPPAARAGT